MAHKSGWLSEVRNEDVGYQGLKGAALGVFECVGIRVKWYIVWIQAKLINRVELVAEFQSR